MAVARSWMLMSRGLRSAKALRNREENKDDVVKLDFNSDPSCLMQEILSNICQKHGISCVKKLNYLNAFVHLINKNSDWKSPDTFGFSTDEILSCLRIALIQDSVQVRAVGLRALRYVIRSEEDVLCLNRLHFPYLIARSLDLLLKSDNERVLMSERIQSLKMMRHILSIAPQHFSVTLVRPLISVALRPIEETDRLLKACIAVLCELCVLNCAVFVECDGVRALLRNATLIPSSHIAEAICGALLFLLNKPSTRESAKVDLRFLISGYTNSAVSEKNSFREEERRLTWTNFALLTMLRSCSGIFELCDDSRNGLKSIVQTLYLNKPSIRKAILELLYELINIPQPEWTEDESVALESIETSCYLESFKLSEGFLVAEGKHYLASISKSRVNLVEVHISLLLICLLDAGLPDALVEVIVSNEASVSLNAAVLLGEFLNLIRKLLPLECYVIPPSLPNLVSYAVRGCPLQAPLSFSSLSHDTCESSSDLYEQYSPSFSYYSKDFHYVNDSIAKSRCCGDISKTLDVRLSFPNLNVPDNCTTKSSQNDIIVTKDKTRSSIDISDQDCIDDLTSHMSADISSTAEKVPRQKSKSLSLHDAPAKNARQNDESVLNRNNVDLPPCKEKQRMALSAVSVLSRLQKKFEKPRQPTSLLLSNVAQYGEKPQSQTVADDSDDKNSKKKAHKISLKELEELIKDTGILIVPEASRWKWESIRILLKLSFNNTKILNDANFKTLLKKLIHFYKPSSKKYSHTPLKFETSRINIYTLVACDLFDILLDARNNDGLKLLFEFLEDFDSQLKQVMEAKSVHDCLLSPLRLSNSLSQDYFLLLGRLSNSDAGLLVLEKCNILQKLNHIATNINLDCYVKLIISSLSYVTGEITRKLLGSVLSCNYVSSRLYATKFLHVLLRTNASKHASFRNWLVEMLVNQLYDDNQTIAMVALNALNEAVDDKEYLDALISLRPSLLHLGDTGLLLLIRFLSTEKGFSYLQAANFVTPQLQRWASSFNVKYTQIVEGELHDALSQYQRGDDGRYRKRITGSKAILKDVIVPPHLYGQLVQHAQGFNLLLKQENVHKMMETILVGNYDSDKAIVELKSALWAMGHFATSSVGAKYLSDHGVVKAIVALAEKVTVYAVKMTAFYVISMIATTKEGVAALNVTGWKSLKRNRHEPYFSTVNPLAAVSLDRLFYDDDSETVLSPVDLESPQNGLRTITDQDEDNLMLKILNNFSFEKKSATLPQRGGVSSQILHNRSFSESKADASDDWSSSGSPPSNIQKYISDIKSTVEPIKHRSDSCGTDSSTSGISSCDSVHGKPSNYSERVSTLSPIPSTSSLTTVMTNVHQKEHRTFLSKRHSSISFGCRLSAQNTLGYKTLRMLQNRHQLSNCPSFSASATMEYLSAPERRQMSPLVRPKFPRYLQKPATPEFEVKDAPFHISGNESMNISSTIESSQFSHSTEIEDDKSEFTGPCYQGICLPLKLSYLFPQTSCSVRPPMSIKKISQQMLKLGNDMELSGDSDSEQMKYDNTNQKFASTHKRRRHDKSACILCSLRPNMVFDGRNIVRSRRTSTSSVHRIRTETESSYGGGIGPENDSPILLTWQQKPTGLIDVTPGGASSSTLDTSDSQSTSLMPNSEGSLKSRSILRKEVLKLIEQLGNPVLYKTCKQGLLQLKQICGDLFQDICLFSDVCLMLGNINYRIQARQLIQDLFLDAPFHELYEDVNGILNRTPSSQDNEDFRTAATNVSLAEPFASPSDSKPPLAIKPAATSSKDANGAVETRPDERKGGGTSGSLDVIIETDAASDTAKSDRGSMLEYVETTDENMCDRVSPVSVSCDETTPERCAPEGHDDTSSVTDRAKNLYDCRRAYSYPASNYIITGFGVHDSTGDGDVSCDCPTKIPATRSRSVSATCSYLPEIAVMRRRAALQHRIDDLAFGSPSVTGSLLLDGRFNQLTGFSKRSLISIGERSSSVVLAFGNPYEVLDLRPQILIEDAPTANAFKDGSDSERSNEKLIGQTMADTVTRHRKLAAFESPDQSLLLKHNPNA